MVTEAGQLASEAAQILAEAPPRPERHTLSVEENRQALARSAQALGPGPQLWSVRDRSVEGRDGPIPVRVYCAGPHPRSVLVFAHGGGWVLGDLATHDALCRNLTALTECAVVSVDYRQPPEHVFPAAVHDVVDVVRGLLEDETDLGLTGLPVAVGGDSAGGNLAAVAAQHLRGSDRLVHQLLLVPALDVRPDRWPSYQEYASGLPLTRSDMDWYLEKYLAGRVVDGHDPDLAPLRHTDLSGVPPATIITAECDVLRDEAEYYAARLAEAGVPVEGRRFDGMFHTFMLFGEHLATARDAQVYAAERLRVAASNWKLA